jgi:predicted nucleic acid-binding Zn ribbon protein
MRNCPVCNSEVKGRKDKIYCSESCKSSQQYEKRTASDSFFFRVERQLKNNRKILKRYNLTGYTTLRKEVLIEEGFNPHFFTHYWKNNKGQVYLFCFDYGFMEIEQQGKKKYLLVEWQGYMEKH